MGAAMRREARTVRGGLRRVVVALALALAGATALPAVASGEVVIWQYGPTGTGTRQFTDVSGLSVETDGYTYIVQNGASSDKILKLERDGSRVVRVNTTLFLPVSVAASRDGRVAVLASEQGEDRVLVFDRHLRRTTTIGGAGGVLDNPVAIAFGPDGRLYVADIGVDRVHIFARNGDYVRSFGVTTPDADGDPIERTPWSVTAGPGGSIWVGYGASSVFDLAGAVARFDGDGALQSSFANAAIDLPSGLAVSADTVYLADRGVGRDVVEAYGLTGTGRRTVLGPGAARGRVDSPRQLALDCRGRLHVADSGNNRVVVVGRTADRTRCGTATDPGDVPPPSTARLPKLPKRVVLAGSIAFLRGHDVWIARANGSGARRITRDGTAASPYTFVAAAKGANLLVVRKGPDIGSRVYVMRTDGSRRREVALQNRNTIERTVRLNGPGTRVAYGTWYQLPIGEQILNVNGGRIATVDGRDLGEFATEAYLGVGFANPAGTLGLYAYRTVAGEVGDDGYPCHDEASGIGFRRPTTGAAAPDAGFLCHTSYLTHPVIAASGRYIVVAAHQGSLTAAGRIRVLTRRTGVQRGRALTPRAQDATLPDTAPNGTGVAYTVERGGRTSIWVVPPGGGTARRLLANASNPAWSPARIGASRR